MLFYLLGTLYKGKLRYFFLQMNIKKNRKDELDTGDRTKTNKLENATQKTKTIRKTDKKRNRDEPMNYNTLGDCPFAFNIKLH
jgi:hypothetical protein